VTLHDELRELVETFGSGLFRDADQFRAALDDFLPERAAIPGQLNVLNDAVRFGAHARCAELVGQGGDPSMAVRMAGDTLARERGTTEVETSRWAVATLAHAVGLLSEAELGAFLGPGAQVEHIHSAPRPDPPTAKVPFASTLPEAPPRSVPSHPPPPQLPPPHQPTTPVVGPFPPLPTRRDRTATPGRRRAVRVLLAAPAVAGVAVAAFLVIPLLEEEPGRAAAPTVADEPRSSASPRAEEPPRVSAPGKPRVDASPAYRAVAFAISGEVTREPGVTIERRAKGDWVSSEPRFRLPTLRGGMETCVKVRLVRIDGERRKNGPPVRRCGKSQPRDLELIKSDKPCSSFEGAEGAGPGCYAYRLRAVGFAPRSDAVMRIVSTLENGELRPCTSDCTKDLRFDADGRLAVYPATGVYDNTVVTVEIDGVRANTAE
jgi:hypothetical protein